MLNFYIGKHYTWEEVEILIINTTANIAEIVYCKPLPNKPASSLISLGKILVEGI